MVEEFIFPNITAVQHTLVTQRTHLGAKFKSEYCEYGGSPSSSGIPEAFFRSAQLSFTRLMFE
jgi:hypothetical protein